MAKQINQEAVKTYLTGLSIGLTKITLLKLDTDVKFLVVQKIQVLSVISHQQVSARGRDYEGRKCNYIVGWRLRVALARGELEISSIFTLSEPLPTMPNFLAAP